MGELVSKFNKDDLEVLIDAMHEWEAVGNGEYHVSQMVKSIPLPPDDHESHGFIVRIKEHFREREKEIKKSRDLRQEKAILLKAKLILTRNDLQISELFDLAENITENKEEAQIKPNVALPEIEVDDVSVDESVKITISTNDFQKKLELAEHYIKDLGVWDFYQKFLAENPKISS